MKKIVFPLFVIAINYSMVCAADSARSSISLVATVPSKTFHVQPVDPDLLVKDQVLNYNLASGDLSTFRAQFDTSHTAGRIEASLESSAELYNGVTAVPLKVTFNGVELAVGTSKLVLTKAEAKVGRRVDMIVTPTKPAGGYESGSYTGRVVMVFDAVIEP
jgi:hypothetical protein